MTGLPVFIRPDLVQAVHGFQWGDATRGELIDCSEIHYASRIYRVRGHADDVVMALGLVECCTTCHRPLECVACDQDKRSGIERGGKGKSR